MPHPLNLCTPALVYLFFGIIGLLKEIADQVQVNLAQTLMHLLIIAGFAYALNYIGHRYSEKLAWLCWFGWVVLPVVGYLALGLVLDRMSLK
jgi:hypothetical protein